MRGEEGLWISEGPGAAQHCEVCAGSAIDRPRADGGLQVENVVHDSRIGGACRDTEGNGDARRPVIALRLAKELESKVLHIYGVAGDGIVMRALS